MTPFRLVLLLLVSSTAALKSGCTPPPFRPREIDAGFRKPAGLDDITSLATAPADAAAEVPGHDAAGEPLPTEPPTDDSALGIEAVLASVTSRYPPMLAALLERDLASGRLMQAMGRFDLSLSAKAGGQTQGYYESTLLQGLAEQPLATGDTVYGGYRVSDGFLPSYDKDRTQDGGELVFGGRIPLAQNRSIDGRRAGVRKAEIDVALAEPTITAARIGFVRAACNAYYAWVAAGRKLTIARQLLTLAEQRQDGLRGAVERQFLAPIELVDNQRMLAQRRVLVVRAERTFQAAALQLSLFLRDGADAPVVPGESRIPSADDDAREPPRALDDHLALAFRQRPELHRIQLAIDKAETDRSLADNQTLPNLDVVVEAQQSLSDGPYSDRERFELFVGGELKLPLQRRDARGRLQQATAQVQQLRLEQRFLRDRILNEVADAFTAWNAARDQLLTTSQNVDFARELVTAEQRAFELGRSDLLRVQLREAQLADAQTLAVDARLALQQAEVALRAARGDAVEAGPDAATRGPTSR